MRRPLRPLQPKPVHDVVQEFNMAMAVHKRTRTLWTDDIKQFVAPSLIKCARGGLRVGPRSFAPGCWVFVVREVKKEFNRDMAVKQAKSIGEALKRKFKSWRHLGTQPGVRLDKDRMIYVADPPVWKEIAKVSRFTSDALLGERRLPRSNYAQTDPEFREFLVAPLKFGKELFALWGDNPVTCDENNPLRVAFMHHLTPEYLESVTPEPQRRSDKDDRGYSVTPLSPTLRGRSLTSRRYREPCDGLPCIQPLVKRETCQTHEVQSIPTEDSPGLTPLPPSATTAVPATGQHTTPTITTTSVNGNHAPSDMGAAAQKHPGYWMEKAMLIYEQNYCEYAPRQVTFKLMDMWLEENRAMQFVLMSPRLREVFVLAVGDNLGL